MLLLLSPTGPIKVSVYSHENLGSAFSLYPRTQLYSSSVCHCITSQGPNIYLSIPPESCLCCSGSTVDPVGSERRQASLSHLSRTDTPGPHRNTFDPIVNTSINTTFDTTVGVKPQTALGHLDIWIWFRCKSVLVTQETKSSDRSKSVCVCVRACVFKISIGLFQTPPPRQNK